MLTRAEGGVGQQAGRRRAQPEEFGWEAGARRVPKNPAGGEGLREAKEKVRLAFALVDGYEIEGIEAARAEEGVSLLQASGELRERLGGFSPGDFLLRDWRGLAGFVHVESVLG